MPQPKSTNITFHAGRITRERRQANMGQRGVTLWLTGLSGSGKSTIAVELERRLIARDRHVYRLDGDNIRLGLNKDLGFSAADRNENIRRIGEVAKLFADSGMICVCSFVSPYQADRDAVRAIHAQGDLAFFEVHVDTPLAVAEKRDPKGLYQKARAGQITGFTGVDDPFEPPEAPELTLPTADQSVGQSADQLIALLQTHEILPSQNSA